jgi:hypothetical protein
MPSRRSSQFAAWDRLATSWWTHRSRGGGRCRIILVCIGLSLMPHGTFETYRLTRRMSADRGRTIAIALDQKYLASCRDFMIRTSICSYIGRGSTHRRLRARRCSRLSGNGSTRAWREPRRRGRNSVGARSSAALRLAARRAVQSQPISTRAASRHRMVVDGFRCRFVASAIVSAYD